MAVIISVLAAIAYPRYASAVTRARLDAAARRVVIDLRFTQQRARTKSAAQRLRFVAGSSQYVIEQSEGDDTWSAISNIDRAIASYRVDLSEPPYEVHVQYSVLEDVIFEFNGFGDPAANASIAIFAGADQRVIKLDAATGGISVTRGAHVISDPEVVPLPE